MGTFKILAVLLTCGFFVSSSGATDQSSDGMETTSDPMTPTMESMSNVSNRLTPGTDDGDNTMPMKDKDGMPEVRGSEIEEVPEMTNEDETGNEENSRHEDRQPLSPPVWSQCLSEVSSEDLSGANIIAVFSVWCRNHDAIIECLSRDLPDSAFTNPFDFFLYLNFDPVRLMNKSKDFCSKLDAVSSDLTCASTQNETLSAGCGHGFARGLFHIFDIFNHRDVPDGILEEIACDVTTQTTLCLKQTLPDCDEDVITPVMYYYALFTNDTCVAQPGQIAYPAPKRPVTIITKCANEAAQSLTSDQSEPQPTSLVDFVILGIKADCKSYEARYSCYHRELSKITNFLDFWLSLTFDYKNALTSQQSYCAQIEESVIPGLTDACFNQSQPGLTDCENGFKLEVETIGEELERHADIDEVELQTIACRTSVTRAVCLGNAMKHCGDNVAHAMSASEMGILPDICRQLLAPRNSGDSDPEADNHQAGGTQSDDSLSYGVQSGPNRNRNGEDREGIRERKNMAGHENHGPNQKVAGDSNDRDGNKMEKDKENSLSASKSHTGDKDNGVGVLRLNVITLSFVTSLIILLVLKR